MNEQTKPELGINFNDLPPGSYIIKDGKLLPNLNDEAMKKRDAILNPSKDTIPNPSKDVILSLSKDEKEEIKKLGE